MIQRKPYETDEKLAAVADCCRDDLKFLCTQFLGYSDWDIVHDDVQKFLMRAAKKKALLLPRGHLKSTLVTVAYTVQAILRNPNVRVLIANQVWDMSRRFLGEVKAQLEGSQLKYLFGDFQSSRWNADDIIVKQRTKPHKEPTVLTTGVEAETTGGHFDLILMDDLTGLQNSATPDQREKTKRFRRSMVNLLEPGGTLIDIGTRWHLDDTFSEIFEKEARYYDVMVRKVVENGTIIFPKHFSKKFNPITKDWVSVPTENCMDYIQHLKESMPMDEYLAQYENNPISPENQIFKEEMFKYWNKRPEGLYVGMAVDLAISQRTEADYTAMVVLGMDSKWDIFVLDYMRGHWGVSDIVKNVFDMQERWKPNTVGMETNGFQRTLKLSCEDEMRRRKKYFPIEEIRTGPDQSKINRIKSLEPFYRQGKVSHAFWMKGKDFEGELLTFPKGKHDDIIDAVSMALPLMSPGQERQGSSIPENSWEWWFRKAKESDTSTRGFFGQDRG
jgi:predicted phage terminase large subunit-like protein